MQGVLHRLPTLKPLLLDTVGTKSMEKVTDYIVKT